MYGLTRHLLFSPNICLDVCSKLSDVIQAENVIKELHKTFPVDGLLPIYINPHTGVTSHSTITFGAMGDR